MFPSWVRITVLVPCRGSRLSDLDSTNLCLQAYSLSFNEGTLPFAYQPSPDGEPWSGELFLRVLGDDKKEKKSKLSPLIIIPSGPGLPHDVMETLEAAAFSDRRIILFDPM